MTTEEDFQAQLDAEPDNHTLRRVFADWLDDMGDPRGPGYRALGVLAKNPGIYGLRGYFGRDTNGYYGIEKFPEGRPYLLPDDWFLFVESNWTFGGDGEQWRYQDGRCGIENAAAIAFAQLTPERQAELLASRLEAAEAPV